jgi:hypothetical protein
MNGPDVWSILALAVASGSLFISWRAYRRAGARIHVRAAHEHHSTYAGGLFESDVVAVHVSSRGTAAVEVKAVEFEVAGKDTRITYDEGPTLPRLLPGFHSEDWAIDVRQLATAAGLPGGSTTRIRAWVTLGNDDQEHSKWLRHTVADTR